MNNNCEFFLDEYKVINLNKQEYNLVNFINKSNTFDADEVSISLLNSKDINEFSNKIKTMKQNNTIKSKMIEIYEYLLAKSSDMDFKQAITKAEKSSKKIGWQVGVKAGMKAERIAIAKRMLLDDMNTYKVNKYTGLNTRVLKKLKQCLNR